MYKTIKNKEEYIHAVNVSKFPINNDGKKEVRLFGRDVLLEDNEWAWHLHLKLTDACNGKCFFCVEQNSKCKQNADLYIEHVEKMLSEMEREKVLFSVSVTGGEPLLFPKFAELCEVLRRHDIKFLTMNTNGTFLEQNLELIDGLFDFVDISRHYIDEEQNQKVFQTKVPTIEELKRIKSKMHHTKIRLQCVLCENQSYDYVMEYIKVFDFADDISFRKLMTLDRTYGVEYNMKDDIYFKILEYVFQNFELKEQGIQDYYVYEIWNINGKDVVFRYSNMEMLLQVEKQENENIYREFIIHPDGVVSGSWKKDKKILLK